MKNEHEHDKKQLVYDLNKYKNKIVYVKFVGGKEIIGKLIGFDTTQNLVLVNPCLNHITWDYGRYVLCCSSSVISIALGYPTISKEF